ncbi:hypothetical protein WJU23_19305 [Prosthecobacter sp. SYSU 5D2]|uniref:hypothetical protein n=1 Tax=Prosthecobacter sp. SYSU 5D2 TaxID=3134134 RepID=UPI0031FEF1A8
MQSPLPQSSGIFSMIGAAFRQNRTACLLLNVLVITLVTSYYQVPAVAGIWEAIGNFKLRWSFAFSLTSTIFAAAVLPFGVQALMGTLPEHGRWKRLLLSMLFWGYRGMEIDLFYRFQGFLFGHGNDVLTLLKKVALDQFVFSPLWFVPTYLIALRWIELGANWKCTRASLDRDFWLRTCPAVMVTNWLVWIPALALIYSLPAALQFPLFSLVMCFFVLIVTLLASRKKAAGD